MASDLAEAGLAPDAAHNRAREKASQASDQVRARVDAVQALLTWYQHGLAGIRDLRSALDRLRILADPWVDRVTLWWAECCLVDEQFDDLRASGAEVTAVADNTGSEHVAVRQLHGAR